MNNSNIAQYFANNHHSKSGFITGIWGPLLWPLLHIICLYYPIYPTESDKRHYFEWITGLRFVLPCIYCQRNFIANLKSSNFGYHVFKSRFTLCHWLFDMHNTVNRMLGKSNFHLNFQQTMKMYEIFRASNCGSRNNNKSQELGCLNSTRHVKPQCIVHIVPHNNNSKSLQFSRKCFI